MKGKLIKGTAEAYALGYRLGVVRGQLIAAAATPEVARAYDRATLSMINAAHAATIGGDAADYELHDEWARGVNEGQRVQLAHEAELWGHGRESRLEQGLRLGLEAVDEAARA